MRTELLIGQADWQQGGFPDFYRHVAVKMYCWRGEVLPAAIAWALA